MTSWIKKTTTRKRCFWLKNDSKPDVSGTTLSKEPESKYQQLLIGDYELRTNLTLLQAWKNRLVRTSLKILDASDVSSTLV